MPKAIGHQEACSPGSTGAGVLYALLVIIVLPAVWHWLSHPVWNVLGPDFPADVWRTLRSLYAGWFFWLWSGLLIGSRVALRLPPSEVPWRRAALVLGTGFPAAMLTVAGYCSLIMLATVSLAAAGIPERSIALVTGPLWAIVPAGRVPDTYFLHAGWWLALALIWSGVLVRSGRHGSDLFPMAGPWLRRGGMLTLALALPAHLAALLRGVWFEADFTAFYLVTTAGIVLVAPSPLRTRRASPV